jgi:hypothetical protein
MEDSEMLVSGDASRVRDEWLHGLEHPATVGVARYATMTTIGTHIPVAHVGYRPRATKRH